MRERWRGLLLVALFASACAPARPPVLTPSRDATTARSVVVLVPGLSGVQLREREGGRVVWGASKNLFFPRDGGYDLALPLDTALDGTTALEPFAPLLQIRLFKVIRREIYMAMVRLMQANGYRVGDLERPGPDEDFFIFRYDWRLDSIQSAQRLGLELERLRRSREAPRLDVNLICQSNAALICRYLAKYGTASLEQAERGEFPEGRPSIERLILIGAANGGSLRILHELERGRKYVPLIGRRMRPETLFTFRSLLEGLPVYRRDLFFDSRGEAIDLDLFDPLEWERRGWSVFSNRARRRVARAQRPELFGDEAMRRRHLQRWLDRAARLHALLREDPPTYEPPRIYLLQDAYRATHERALLEVHEGEWRTSFTHDRAVRADPFLESIASGPGDGHATLESTLFLSPRELGALARPPVNVRGGHFDVIRSPAAGRHILEFLRD